MEKCANAAKSLQTREPGTPKKILCTKGEEFHFVLEWSWAARFRCLQYLIDSHAALQVIGALQAVVKMILIYQSC